MRIGEAVDAADPEGLVLSRSRILCAGLAELALAVCGNGSQHAQQVADLAASLSILTKIEDEVIDSLAFHGGQATPRPLLRARTQRFLAPSLEALASGVASRCEPRIAFAAALGRRIAALAHTPSARRALLQLLEDGWATQVDAVVLLTDDPQRSDVLAVGRVTRRISGDWLSLIAACGTLPAGEPLRASEIEAIRDAGAFIQRADALADLDKDQREGLSSTWAACRLAASGLPIETPAQRYRAAGQLRLEQEALPSPPAAEAIETRLQRFPELCAWLVWIRSMLLARYRLHPDYFTGALSLAGGASCGAR